MLDQMGKECLLGLIVPVGLPDGTATAVAGRTKGPAGLIAPSSWVAKSFCS